MSLNLRYTFDENLQEVLENPKDAHQHVQTLLNQANTAENPLERSKNLGLAGVFLRMLRKLEEAQMYLEEAIQILSTNPNHRQLCIQQIRLAHVYQWQKDFSRSNILFDQLLESEQKSELADFVWQHVGKNYFDQKRYKEALDSFQNALKLRQIKNSPKDQIESSENAISETLKRLGS